jgi:hypothetical protein
LTPVDLPVIMKIQESHEVLAVATEPVWRSAKRVVADHALHLRILKKGGGCPMRPGTGLRQRLLSRWRWFQLGLAAAMAAGTILVSAPPAGAFMYGASGGADWETGDVYYGVPWWVWYQGYFSPLNPVYGTVGGIAAP